MRPTARRRRSTALRVLRLSTAPPQLPARGQRLIVVGMNVKGRDLGGFVAGVLPGGRGNCRGRSLPGSGAGPPSRRVLWLVGLNPAPTHVPVTGGGEYFLLFLCQIAPRPRRAGLKVRLDGCIVGVAVSGQVPVRALLSVGFIALGSRPAGVAGVVLGALLQSKLVTEGGNAAGRCDPALPPVTHDGERWRCSAWVRFCLPVDPGSEGAAPARHRGAIRGLLMLMLPPVAVLCSEPVLE